jgi:uncharacterized membrane protein
MSKNDVPVQVIVATFQNEGGAEDALQQLKEAQKEDVIDIENAALLRRDEGGTLHMKEPRDMHGGKGAAIGGVTGAVAGLLAGPVVLAAGIGALIGGLAAKLRDSGFRDDRLKQLGEALTPGTSALVAVIEHTWVRDAEQMLRERGATVMTESITADIAEQLGAGHAVAYTAVATDEGIVAGRMTSEGEQLAPEEAAGMPPPQQPGASGESESQASQA